MRRFAKFLSVLGLGVLGLGLWNHQATGKAKPSAPAPQSPVDFNRDIRPILSDHCFSCHGFDKNRRKADLRLDTKDGLLGSGDNGPIVKPGDPSQSDLLSRIHLPESDAKHMPPKKGGKALDASQVKLLERWIQEGAKWKGHWAFEPLAKASPPVFNNPWGKSPIDAWIYQGMVREGFKPSPEADRRTLLRRLSFDLTGLPPTPGELAAFESDTAPNAYEKQVDRLLASPRFGERMAMWWLDVVRYADSVGYHGDQEVSVHPFREYVIQSFNSNVPFDRFSREQIAGDLLPNAGEREKIASGYNRLGMMSAEGGVQDKEYLAKYAAERVRNASGVWLGVTFGCAECHDHKYDPLATKEFYQFEAFFADIKEQGLYGGNEWGSKMRVPTPAQKAELAKADADLVKARAEADKAAANFPWKTDLARWKSTTPAKAEALDKVTLKKEADGFLLAQGPNPAKNTYTLTFDKDLPKTIQGVRVEAWPKAGLPGGGPGRAGNGNFVLSEIELAWKAADGKLTPIELKSARATFEQTHATDKNPYKRWAAEAAIDKDVKGPTWGWAVLGDENRPQAAEFFAEKSINLPEGASLVVTLKQNLDNPQHTLGNFRVLLAGEKPQSLLWPWPKAVGDALAREAKERTPAQTQEIEKFSRELGAANDPTRAALAELVRKRDEIANQAATTLVTETVPPRQIRVLARGNWMDEKGEVVQPGTPAVLPPLKGLKPGQRATRLDLANWIVSAENPLTSRVIANRLWKLMFGAGLSRNLDDLGSQGDRPSHPELLDHIAQRLIDGNWDIKAFLKELVMTQAYRQSSEEDAVRREKDPANRLLSRQGRFRLDAEVVRDTVLYEAGMLTEKIGGPSVRPYQPAGYWAYLNFPTREWQSSQGSDLYRRGLYVHWQRQYLHPSMLAFDAPCREECTPDRSRSNTPLQALVLLNDPIYVEAARVLGENTARQTGSDTQRLEWMTQKIINRKPGIQEKEILDNLLSQQRARFKASPAQAKELVSTGEWPKAQGIDPAEHAAWTMVARALFNLHETITRE